MKIIKYKKLKDNRYEIILDNDEKVILYDDVIVKFNLLALNNIDQKQLNIIKKYNYEKAAYYKSLKYMNKRLRCEKEIVKYLIKLNYAEDIINKTINDLKSDGYLNKEVYINAYVNDALNLRKKGPLVIIKELEKLEFSRENIDIVITKIPDNTWLERIEKIIEKKIKTNRNKGSRVLKDQIIRDLIYLGYPKYLIDQKINEVNFTDSSIIKKEYQKIKNKLEKKYSNEELNYHIKNKLYQKGFTVDDINQVINED